MRHREESGGSCGGATRRFCRGAFQVNLGCGAWTAVLLQPAVILRRSPLLLASSVDPWKPRKPDACLRVVRLAEGATERSIFKGSRWPTRNHHGHVGSEPANARLTAATKPFRGRKTSQTAYIVLMRPTTAASTRMKPLAPIALYGSSCRAVGQCRGDGAIGRTFRGATQSPLRPSQATRTAHADTSEPRRHRDLSVSRSDLDADRQVQLDETRLQQRHGQVIVQFNPGVGVAWRPPELLEDDLAGPPKR